MDAHGWLLWKSDRQFKLTTDGLDIATKRRKVHVSLILDLGYGWLFDLQCGRDIGLGLASDLAQRAQGSVANGQSELHLS